MDVTDDGEEGQCRTIVYLLASQKLLDSPFSEETIRTARGQMNRILKEEEKDENGVTSWVRPEATDRQQPVAIRPFQSFMRFCEDLDWRGLHKCAKGVKLGWDVKLPRTPAVFERKTHWALGPDVPDLSDQDFKWEPNHKSLKDHAEICPEHFDSEIKKDRVERVLVRDALRR